MLSRKLTGRWRPRLAGYKQRHLASKTAITEDRRKNSLSSPLSGVGREKYVIARIVSLFRMRNAKYEIIMAVRARHVSPLPLLALPSRHPYAVATPRS